MTTNFDMNTIRSLPIPQRIELAHAILGTITEESHPQELTREFKDELDRRLAWDEANPDGGIPWEQVEAAALARVRG
jgi:putative addiction module component (TIGR02574 family)